MNRVRPVKLVWACYTYQKQEPVFEVLVRLNAAILRAFVIQGARGVEEGHIAIPPSTQIYFLQLQLVG